MSEAERNAVVAEKVMGWHVYHYDKDIPECCYYMLMDEKFDPVVDEVGWNAGARETEQEAWNDNKSWTTDISAAWEVIEALTAQGLYTDIQAYPDFYIVSVSGRQATVFASVAIPSAPEAICLAALKSLGVEATENVDHP